MKAQHGMYLVLPYCWRLKIVGDGCLIAPHGAGGDHSSVCMWRDGGMEGWRDGGVEEWRGSYIPLLPNDILTGHPHPIVSCPTALPSHLSHPKIHISQPSCPKTFPILYLPQPGSVPSKPTHLSCCSPPLPPPAHFLFSPQPEQMKNVLGQEGRGRRGGGGKNQTHGLKLAL